MEEILVVRTSALGDILHGIPVAAALKERFPRCRITWVADERYTGILDGHPWVDRLITVRFKEGIRSLLHGRGRRNWVVAARMLERLRFDVAVDLQGLMRSGVITYLSGAPVRIGFPRGQVRETLNRVFTNLRPRTIPARSHVIDRNLALLHPLGIYTRERRFSLKVPPSVEEGIQRYLLEMDGGRETFRVALNPAAGWITKRWNPDRYAEIGDRISKARDATVFLLWGPGERGLAERVKRHMQGPGHVVPEMGLQALAALLRGCDLFVGGDSGPLHLASALGVPVLGLYGPSDPARNGPFRDTDRVVAVAEPCGPCYRRNCARASCMDSIPVEQVWQAVTDMVGRLGERARESRAHRARELA